MPGTASTYDHADWAEAQDRHGGGQAEDRRRSREPAVVLTPKAFAKPRINGPKVFGVRPGAPFLFTIPASGDRPMTFAAEELPAGLQLDSDDGPHHRARSRRRARTP